MSDLRYLQVSRGVPGDAQALPWACLPLRIPRSQVKARVANTEAQRKLLFPVNACKPSMRRCMNVGTSAGRRTVGL